MMQKNFVFEVRSHTLSGSPSKVSRFFYEWTRNVTNVRVYMGIPFYELGSFNDPGGSLSRAFKLTEVEPAEGRRAPYALCGVKNIVWR